MDNGTTILIDLWKDDSGITVTANIRFSHPLDGNYSFYIAEGFVIDNINDGISLVEYESHADKLEFRAPTKRLEVKSSGIKELFLTYHGKVTSWHTLYEQDILAVNLYTAWYPTDLSIHTKYIVKVHLDDTFYVVNGRYDEIEKLWYYQPLDYDVNIIALRKYEITEGKNVALYYYGKENTGAVMPYYENYNKIVDYYTALYGSSKLDKTNIVILPEENEYGGYFRKALIVFDGIREDYDEIVHTLAHEIAHSWCQGARTDSWEDWLNETFAEWSALLFELEVNHNLNKFNAIILEKANSITEDLPIKTKDLSRPEEVHDNGVLQLYKLFQTNGANSIKKILRAFDTLKEKTTDNLIGILKENRETVILAEFISDMIK